MIKTTSLLLATMLMASQSMAQNNKFSAEDIFELEYASDVQISHDGGHIAYVRSGYDIMTDGHRSSVWLFDLDKQSNVPLLADGHQYSQPRWSPDGKKLAYVSDASGSRQLHLYWLDEDKSAVLTQLQKGVSDISWSPDGKWLAFTMDVPQGKSDYAKSVKRISKPKGAKWSEEPIIVDKVRYQADGRGLLEPAFKQVFVIPASGGTPRQLTQGEFQHYGPLAWRPDGQALLFSANFNPDWEYQTGEADIHQVDLQSGNITAVTQQPGSERQPMFSADGKYLTYLQEGNEPVPYNTSRVALLKWGEDSPKILTDKLDRSVDDVQWQGSRNLVIQYDDNGKRKLAELSLAGKLKELTDELSGTSLGRPYISGRFSLADNGAIAFTLGTAQRPADLGYLYKGKQRQLTALNDDLLSHKELGQVHEIEYASSFDGEKIQGWYITPPGFDPAQQYPLLLEIHGGPHLAYGPHFAAELQRYAAEGYVVFYANHRGSTSYGERFAMLLDGKYSSKEDFADHNSGVDALLAKGFIDKNNLFIAGGSAGGIATAYAIGLTDRFNAAAITKPVINWVSKVLTADSYLGQIRNQFPGMPWDNLEHYWQRSPLSLVGNVKTPSLIMTGEADRRTPISESEQFYQALKLQKVDTVLVRVPGAPHGIAGKPSRMIAKIEHTLAWFERYKK
ncbi:S9 family peptidase [Bowmanella denitrificans]|uniref:S9 family peptidase n=1 Tax=Bowmanella denitrificans TaxID=366582 RepID=A0ABP3HCP1_9ALTE